MQSFALRALAFVTLAGALAHPQPIAAQMPAPTPTNAIKNTQHGIKKAQKSQLHAQKKSKTGSNRVGVGGAHTDSEVPNNPGETSNKPGAAPGYGGGQPAVRNPAPTVTAVPNATGVQNTHPSVFNEPPFPRPSP